MLNIYFMILTMVVSYFYMTFSQFLGYFICSFSSSIRIIQKLGGLGLLFGVETWQKWS